MKIEDIAKKVYEIGLKYEKNQDPNLLKTQLFEIAKIVEKEPNLYGSFTYSPTDSKQPLLGIFYQGNNNCLSFTYGGDKFFYNYNGKSQIIDNEKSIIRELPKKKQKIIETPAIKIEFAPKVIEKIVIPKCNCRKCRKHKK